MKTSNERSRFLIAFILLLSFAFATMAQTGGGFDLSQNVIAGSGGNSTSEQFAVDGIAGQMVEGTLSFGGAFNLRSGFWAFIASTPTGASVYVSGKVQTSDGRGIGKVTISLQGINNEPPRYAVSNPMGYFVFYEVPVGETYLLTASAKQHQFIQPTQMLFLVQEINDVMFVALE